MTQTTGFFSVIQFCPNLDRSEYANVGIVLAVPQAAEEKLDEFVDEIRREAHS